MAIPLSSRYHYHTVLHADRNGDWAGIADEDDSDRLLGSHPSLVVSDGRVTMTRRSHEILTRGSASRASFDGGEALRAVLREGDRLACWKDGFAEVGLSVSRARSLVLGLGTLGHTPGSDITIDIDPRVKERELAQDVRGLDQPATRIVWLDPARPSELEARLRELDGDLAGVKKLAFVARTDDEAVSLELNRRVMGRDRPGLGATVFLTASERFSGVEEWLQYGRALSTERRRDLWLRIRSGNCEGLVPQGTSATIDRWLVYVRRVHERGVPGRPSQLGLVGVEAGVTPAMLEGSTLAMARGLTGDFLG
jgi:hypothetical protein